MRSIKAPDMIEAVVAANSANAPQKTPSIWSSVFGPIKSALGPHAHAIELAYSAPEIPLGPAAQAEACGEAPIDPPAKEVEGGDHECECEDVFDAR